MNVILGFLLLLWIKPPFSKLLIAFRYMMAHLLGRLPLRSTTPTMAAGWTAAWTPGSLFGTQKPGLQVRPPEVESTFQFDPQVSRCSLKFEKWRFVLPWNVIVWLLWSLNPEVSPSLIRSGTWNFFPHGGAAPAAGPAALVLYKVLFILVGFPLAV